MAKVEIGGPEDALHIRLGELSYVLTEHYELKCSFFQQPAAFTLRLGPKLTEDEDPNGRRERLVIDVLSAARPGTEFELFIQRPDGARVIIQSGKVDSRGSPGAMPLQAEIKGRDYMAQLFDAYVEEETTFTEKTYYDLVRKVLDIVGLKEQSLPDGSTRFALLVAPENNKRVNASRRQKAPRNTQVIRQIETGAGGGTGKVVLQTPTVKLGTRWYDFLQQVLKLGALWLYATGEGNFVLTRPNIDQEPAFYLYRRAKARAGVIDEYSNVLDHRFDDDTTQRHSEIIVYGRGGGGKAGRNKYKGVVTDKEMVAYGFNKKLTVHDEDVKSNAECEYVARKMMLEERRAGWRLSYVVAGHTMESLANPSGRAIWGPDMMCQVADDQLSVKAELWLDSVTFNRNPHATTTVELAWPNDLVIDPPPTPAVPKPSKKDFAKDPDKQPKAPAADSPVAKAAGNTATVPSQDAALLEGGSGGTGSAGPGYGARSPKNTSGGEGGASGLGPTRSAGQVPAPSYGARSPNPNAGGGGTSGSNQGGGGGAAGF
jgi:hypothetical protein